MTSRERFLTALSGGVPDRIPIGTSFQFETYAGAVGIYNGFV